MRSRLRACPVLVCRKTPMSAVRPLPVEAFPIRHDWARAEVEALLALPLPELLHLSLIHI